MYKYLIINHEYFQNVSGLLNIIASTAILLINFQHVTFLMSDINALILVDGPLSNCSRAVCKFDSCRAKYRCNTLTFMW